MGSCLCSLHVRDCFAVCEDIKTFSLLYFYLSHRGPGRRKKNPDIPPELLNNPFKHFKVDNHTDRSVNLSNGEAIKTDDTNKSTSHDSSPSDGVTISFEGPRDANNNTSSTAHKDLQFKRPSPVLRT